MKTKIRPADLRYEILPHTLYIGAAQSRLSWIVESGVRPLKQSAYQVLVADNLRRAFLLDGAV